MNSSLRSTLGRLLRKQRVRARVTGTAARPRLSVYVSNRHINAQIIDDTKQSTLVSASTVGNKDIKSASTMTEKAAALGAQLAKKAKKAKISKVVFDRGSHAYARRLQSLADAARKEGLEF